MQNKYYAYLLINPRTYKVGEGASKNQSGISENWKECEKIVSGKEARYRGFASREEAEKWLRTGANYEIKPGKPVNPRTYKVGEGVKKLERGIYFDSGTGRNQKVEISVTDENKKDLLDKISPKIRINKFGKHSVPKATNNYGELLACKYALQIAFEEKVKNIFGDSRLVLDYWSKGYIKKDMPKKTAKLSKEVSGLRYKFEKGGGKIEFIEGDYNPADLGFHR